jgi:hypothetical protein
VGSAAARLVNHLNYVNNTRYTGVTFAGSSIENHGSFTVSNDATIGFNTDSTLAGLGTLANHGGTFAILGTLDNAGHTFRVDNNSGNWVLAGGGTIRGGSIETGDGNSLWIPFSTIATLDDVRVNGRIIVTDRLRIPAGQALSGTGEIIIKGAEAPEGDGSIQAQSGTTIIGPGITIHGGVERPNGYTWFDAMVGARGADLINHGAIRCDAASILGSTEMIQLGGGTITNDGTLEVTKSAVIIAWGDLEFAPGGKLVIDGGGELDVYGRADLSSDEDFLDVLPKADALPYDHLLIVDSAGITGEFSHVTAGITVDYSTPGKIYITGTPVPEPMGTALLAIAAGLVLRRRRVSNKEAIAPAGAGAIAG